MKLTEYMKKHPVNRIVQLQNPDGSYTCIVYKFGWKKPYKYRFRRISEKPPRIEILEEDEVGEL